MTVSLAWRNLWRNRRRSLLSAGGIAFAVMLLVFMMCFQLGQYQTMIDNGTALVSGHAQVQHPEYNDTPRLRYAVGNAAAVRATVAAHPAVQHAALRAQSFVLMSNNDSSSGVLLMGVEPSIEEQISSIPKQLAAGRFLSDADEQALVLGAGSARTLEAAVGDEVVVLGNARDGTVAVLLLKVVGIFETAQSDINRTFAYMPLAAFQQAFLLDDAVTSVVLRMFSGGAALDVATQLQRQLQTQLNAQRDRQDDGPGLRVLAWNTLMPELEQSINIDWYSGLLIYGLLAIMVLFSIVNTFVMTVYERTREFGMVMALGARPRLVLYTLQLEALLLALIGTAIGVLAGLVIVLALAQVGISLGDQGAELLRSFHMPERLYPTVVPVALIVPPLLMLIGTQLAALVPGMQVFRLHPIEALRAQE